MRPIVIAGNWKMHTRLAEAKALAEAVRKGLPPLPQGVQIVLCPPFISLAAVREMVGGSPIALGAQNLHFADQGAYTGEVSPLMLAGLCQYVIIGHSERRQYFHEEDEFLQKKVAAAFRVGLTPILCVGETLEQHGAGQTEAVVCRQLQGALQGLQPPRGRELILAYEPVWAIGTGNAATGVGANGIITYLRSCLAELWGTDEAGRSPILYGGSVTPANTAEFISQPDVDGALVGGASLKAPDFLAIIREAIQAKDLQ
jgi:triosephosphate isomerase